MENTAFTCDSPTVRPEVALRDRLDRIETRSQILRELDAYLEAVRAADRIIEVEA